LSEAVLLNDADRCSKSTMMTVMLSVDFFRKASSTRRRESSLGSMFPKDLCLATKSTASLYEILSHIPSQATMTNSSSGSISKCLMKGVTETRSCSVAGLLKAGSPKARLTERSPQILPWTTNPPAAMILFFFFRNSTAMYFSQTYTLKTPTT